MGRPADIERLKGAAKQRWWFLMAAAGLDPFNTIHVAHALQRA
jgi:hypothetical protein